MNTKTLLIIIFLTPYSGFAQNRNTEPGIPDSLHIYNTAGDTYVDHVMDTCLSRRYHLSPNHVKYDAIFSVLLTAQTTQKKVQLKYNGCVNNNQQGEIIGVYLVD